MRRQRQGRDGDGDGDGDSEDEDEDELLPSFVFFSRHNIGINHHGRRCWGFFSNKIKRRRGHFSGTVLVRG